MFNAIRSAKEAIDNDVLEQIKSYNNQRIETEATSASSN